VIGQRPEQVSVLGIPERDLAVYACDRDKPIVGRKRHGRNATRRSNGLSCVRYLAGEGVPEA
jgi:hypothetical protein